MKDMIQNVIDAGCTISVCPPCTKVRGYTQDDLIEGVQIKGSVVIHEPIKEGAAVLTF
jgi:predicted peroxiredoxin